MSSKALCALVRGAVIFTAACGIIACCSLPSFGLSLVSNFPDYSHIYLPWLIFLWLTSMPLFILLFFIWKISTAIIKETVFTTQTAGLVRICAIILFATSAFFIIGNIIFLLLGMSHPGVLFLSLIADVFVISLAVVLAVLARYLTKAAALQEEADSFI